MAINIALESTKKIRANLKLNANGELRVNVLGLDGKAHRVTAVARRVTANFREAVELKVKMPDGRRLRAITTSTVARRAAAFAEEHRLQVVPTTLNHLEEPLHPSGYSHPDYPYRRPYISHEVIQQQ